MNENQTPLWLKVALREIGQAEVPGSRHNPRIVAYHRETELGATSDEVPWCASFVNWCLAQAGVIGTRSAMARSFEKWGRLVPFTKGAIVVLERGAAPSGHVGFFVGSNASGVQLLGGNQSDKVSVATFPLSKVLGTRWPTMARALAACLAMAFSACAGTKVKVGACYEKVCATVEVER